MKRTTIQYPHAIRAVFAFTLVTLVLATVSERAAAQSPPVIYVDADDPAGNGGDGITWATAYADLQTALAEARTAEQGGHNVQVWVAEGTYYPDVSGSGDSDNRDATFTISSFPVYGGFQGGESSISERPENAHRSGIARTVVSGEIQQDGDEMNNAYAVVTISSGEGVLDGFVVTGGYDLRSINPSSPDGVGGGVTVTGEGATVRNSIIRNNEGDVGAGVGGYGVGYTLTNVLLTSNSGETEQNPAVGGLSIGSGITIVVRNVTIADNFGWAIAGTKGTQDPVSATVENSILVENEGGVAPAGTGAATITTSIHDVDSDCSDPDITCSGVINQDPQFRSDPMDYTLTGASPALDAGDNSLVSSGVSTDGAFRSRIQGGTVDLGAYEGGEKVLPVELVAFTAQRDGRSAVLQWETASETNNAGFYVQRRTSGGTWRALEDGFVEGAGTTTEAQVYHFATQPLGYGHHAFRLRQVDTDGSETLSAAVEVAITPQEAGLSAPYPNPARGTATLELVVSRRQDVRVEAFDLLGRRVATLHEGEIGPGEPRLVRLSGARLASGVYLVRARGEDFTATQKVTLVE